MDTKVNNGGKQQPITSDGKYASYGYHAGDLGKSESYYQQSGSRGTGHYGTGTYFVGNPKDIETYNDNSHIGMGKAPHHKIDFNKYFLFEPGENALDLHKALKKVDNLRFIDVQDYDDYENLVDDLYYVFNSQFDRDTLEYLLSETLDYAQLVDDLDYKTQSLLDSPSTYFMKQLGYEGIDVRGNQDVDNTSYGSVIYDLHDEDFPQEFLERREKEKELRDKYKIEEHSNSYKEALERLKLGTEIDDFDIDEELDEEDLILSDEERKEIDEFLKEFDDFDDEDELANLFGLK